MPRATGPATCHAGCLQEVIMQRLVAAMVLLVLSGAGCGGSEEAGSSGDPYGLTELEMPAAESEIFEVLESLPRQISGIPQRPGPENVLAVLYGDRNSISAIPFPLSGSTGESIAEDLAQFESEAGAVVELRSLDAASELVWLTGSFTDQGGGLVYLAVWGEPDGAWAFNVSAESPELRDAIARAFVDALRTSN
jgi:hypothetical protein